MCIIFIMRYLSSDKNDLYACCLFAKQCFLKALAYRNYFVTNKEKLDHSSYQMTNIKIW